MSPVPSVTPFPPSSSQSHWQMELVMGVGRALLSGVPRGAGLGAEMGAWDAAGVLGPTLTLAGSWQPQICLLLVRTPNPVLSAPLVVWGRAALAHRAHHGVSLPQHQLCSHSWGWQLWLWGLLFSPRGFLSLPVVLEAPVVLHAGGRAGHVTPKMGTWSWWLHPENLQPWGKK